MGFFQYNAGVLVALIIVLLWSAGLWFLLNYEFSYYNPLTYLFILLQTHLFTGIFITAHDAIHGTVSRSRKVNIALGTICTTLFAFNSYQKLYKKHQLHHKFPGTDKDPDFRKAPFLLWYFGFLLEYISWFQIILMAVTFNILKLYFPESNLLLYWVIPSLLSTLQLFFFGTWLPHKGEHNPENKHRARSQSKNHLLSFLSCYFFGYHYEHHNKPEIPWWLLYKQR